MAGTSAQRLVLYTQNADRLSDVVSTPITDFIVTFIINTSEDPMTFTFSGGDVSALKSEVEAVQATGKRVLISFGGGTMGSPNYQPLVGHETAVADALTRFVAEGGFDGIDLDYEDTGALAYGDPYDGVAFISDLTNALAAAFQSAFPGQKKYITHAPQGPYFVQGWNFAYQQVLANTGDAIDYLNIQFYNNPGFEGPSDILSCYTDWADGANGQTPIDPSRMVIGLPVTAGDAGSGYVPLDQIPPQIIAPVSKAFPTFAGMMGWQFLSDPQDTWVDTIGAALHLQSATRAAE